MNKTKNKFHPNQKAIYDSGYGYDIVIFISEMEVKNLCMVKMQSGWYKDTYTIFKEEQLHEYSEDLLNKMKKKYKK